METIKSYTTIEQSRKLAKILPIESADMRYGYTAPYDYSDRMYDGGYDEILYSKDFLIKNPNFSANEYDAELPCWSLAALLNVLRGANISTTDTLNKIRYSCWNDYDIVYADNTVDACYEMIIELNELNLLQL